ncbi:MAG: hypothetical protein LBS26_05735 [Campylobacteraceae bacterium]|jgi:Ca2+/Na+ antiporter|nr:hypothetical protein [Campylobacteraceae bacterium]
MFNIRIVIIALALILLLFFYIKNKNFSKVSKLLTVTLCALAVIFAVVYETAIIKQSETDRETLNSFKQGRTLVCDDIEVTAEKFTFVGGTKVFSAKEYFKDIQGVMIPIKNCRVK